MRNISSKIIFLHIVLFACYTQAEIIEIKEFRKILDYISSDALVLLDIDNTLLEPIAESQVGSDQWFTQMVKEITPLQAALDFYCSTILETSMTIVEPTIPDIIKHIQQNMVVFGFTMRSIILAPRTIEQLEKNSVSLRSHYQNRGFMLEGKYQIMLYGNIIFCQGYKNSKALFAVLDAYDINPHAILMIDDKRHYLEDIERGCCLRGIKFIGLCYGYLNAKIANFLSKRHSFNSTCIASNT
jgi:hypothetical protein